MIQSNRCPPASPRVYPSRPRSWQHCGNACHAVHIAQPDCVFNQWESVRQRPAISWRLSKDQRRYLRRASAGHHQRWVLRLPGFGGIQHEPGSELSWVRSSEQNRNRDECESVTRLRNIGSLIAVKRSFPHPSSSSAYVGFSYQRPTSA